MTTKTNPTAVPGVNPSSPVPLYVQVERLLRARISSAEWDAGDQIPTESELCEQYEVSRVTIRQALSLLVRAGLVVRGRGRGTFIRDARFIAAPRSASSFSTELRELGLKPGSRLISCTEVAADARVAAEMNIGIATPLVRIRRLRTADDRPVGVQDTLLHAERVVGIPEMLHDGISLYQLLREEFGIVPSGATEVFRASGVGSEFSDLLECRAGRHAFEVTRITFDVRGIFEHTTSILRGDRYEIRLALTDPR